MTSKVAGISQREFAARDGCDEKLVRRKIKEGTLQRLPDGKLDPALVGTEWRDRPERFERDKKIANEAQAIVSADGFEIPPKATSEAKKEAYLAELRRLEYEQEAGQLVRIEDVTATVIAEMAKVRTKILAVPTRAAPKLALTETDLRELDAAAPKGGTAGPRYGERGMRMVRL